MRTTALQEATTALTLTYLCAAILLNAACATQASYQRQINHTRAQLLQAGDPDSLEAAALLTGFGKEEPAERLEAFARADAAAPDRPDLIWLHLMAYPGAPPCALRSVVLLVIRFTGQFARL